MRKLSILFVSLFLIGCGTIEEGNVGVVTTFTGKIVDQEIEQGFYTAWTSSVQEYSTREITVPLEDMKPKASDNLSLADLDLEVYYKTMPSQIAELKIKYANRDGEEYGIRYPAYFLVQSYARNSVYNEIARYTSLEIHKNREKIAQSVHENLQEQLNKSDPNVFTITKVIIRSAVTDPSIEESIKLAVARQKELEAKRIELNIAKKQVEINHALDKSLTPAVLKQRALDVQMAAIEKGGNVSLILGPAIPMVNVGSQKNSVSGKLSMAE